MAGRAMGTGGGGELDGPRATRGSQPGHAAEDDGGPDGTERLSLSKSVGDILEETRIILPGAQVLFGFQLVVVFDQGFREHLAVGERYVHLAATLLVAVAIALLIAPAVYHRQAKPERASRR